MNHSRVFFGVFLFACMVIGVLIYVFKTQKSPALQVTNFEQCVKAGFPVMESYPRQCSLPGGKFFVEKTVPER